MAKRPQCGHSRSRPAKAIILAAGFGTRMLPLSLDTPKPMMPFWGKPILGHLLDLLADWGVREVLINLHHQPDAILAFARRPRRDKLRVNLSFESEILGTGGALRKAAWFIGSEPFWIVNGDVAADLDPAPLLRALATRRALAALWLHPQLGPRTVEMRRGLIANFQSSRPGTAGTYTFCGLHLARPAILDYLPERGFAPIIQAYSRAMADAWQIRGVCLPDCFWADLGTPAAYLQAHGEVLTCYRRRLPGRRLMSAEALRRMQALPRRGVRLQGFAAVGAGVVIEKNALLANAVVWDRARIAADAILEQAVVGSGAQVHGRVPRVAVRSDFSLQSEIGNADPQLAVALARLGWDPAATTAIPFEARGSARAFTRLARGRQSVIMIRYSREREENTLYAAHARFLKSIGWPVPEVLLDLPEKQFLVVEDLGDYSLQRLAEVAPARRVLHHYRQVLRLLPILHERGTRAARRRRLELVAPFAPDLYRWEREFFARQFLQPRLGLPSAEIKAILRELEGVARRLLQTPPVLIHRDLQSSNILLVGNNPFFIDFQGMRFGAAAYDLAALLCDPYVELPLARQTELLAYYNATRRAGAPVPERIFWLAAVERLAQALGAYGRLCAQPDTAWFGKYIPPALRMLRRALEQAAACRRLHTAIAAALDKMPAATDNSP